MKRFLVEQIGNVQVEAARSFVVEAPDHFTDEMIENALYEIEQQNGDGLGWRDDDDREWIGFDVDVMETEIYVADDSETAGASRIRFGHDIDRPEIGK